MVEFSAETPRENITFVKGAISLSYPQVYGEGYTLKANEAKALNRTLAENVGNNLRADIAKAVEAAGGDATQVDVAALQAKLDEYVTKYEFGFRKTGTSTGGKKSDPIATAAKAIAKAMVKAAIEAKGHKFAAVSKANPELVKTKIEQLAAREDIVARATQEVEQNRAAAASALDIENLL